MKRTEDEKVCQAPIVVVLGGQEHNIKPLVIRDSRTWRAKVVELLSSLPAYTNVTSDDPDGFGKALQAMLVSMPDTIIDLFFGYALELDRETIETTATDAEIAKGFEQVIEVAFPLARSMVGTMQRLAQ